jgi:serine/threonine-protein kinase
VTDEEPTEVVGESIRGIDAWVARAFAPRYPLVRLLGRGGMGAVYLARDNTLQRTVAIKMLLPELADDPARREQFHHEALTNARLAHPHIVPVHAVGDVDGIPFLVMRYVSGHSLAQRLARGEPMPIEETCRVLVEIASALDYAHRQRVVHRDIKPENILLDRETGDALLTDFGVARFGSLDAMSIAEAWHEREVVRGTRAYMSPEQAAGTWEVDGRSDLYSLGVMGYAMLCGRLPFDGARTTQHVAEGAVAPPRPLALMRPDAPPAVVGVIMRCLETHADDRWTNGASLRRAVLDALDGRDPAHPRGVRAWLRRVKRRRS